MNTTLIRKHVLHNKHHKWLSGLLFLAALSGCGGGSSSGSELGITVPPSNVPPSTTEPTLPPTTTEPALPPASTPIAKAPFTCAEGAITCVEVAAPSAQAQASVPVTFGQPFKAGDWLHTTQGLIAKVNGATIPLQADEISSHRDGSARFAVLSAQLKDVQPGEARIINLYTGAKANSPPSVPADPDWNLEVETQVYDASGNVTATLVAQPQAQLKSQIASNSGRRLSGAVASEYTVVTDFKDKATGAPHPHLSARFHTRLVDGGARIRTDVVMENTRTWTTAPGNITYSMVIKRNGVTLHTQPKFTHYHHARWHKVVWTDAAAQPLSRVRHHMPYFMASKAVWNYDLGLKIAEASLAKDDADLAKARTDQAALGPMGNGLLEKYFPMTGGRSDIGPYPRWTANYLVSQDQRAQEVMLSIADAAAAVPIHYRDEDTSYPLDLDSYPTVSITPSWSSPVLPTVVDGTTIWTPDIAHQASYAYVPYFITGDAFYLDEMMFWTAWNAATPNPTYRDGGQGLAKDNQVRGQAWAMRALGETYRSLPDNHPRKSYFGGRLATNLDWYAKQYPLNPNASSLYPLNAIPKPDEPHLTGPWQNDYFGIVFAQLAENSDPNAKVVLDWVSKFNLGRFNAEAEGFCTARAAAYYWTIVDANKAPYTTWKSLYQANYPGETCSSIQAIDGYPNWSGGYAAGARAMMASANNAGVSNAGTTYSKWRAMTASMDADYANNPTFAIVPR